MRVIDSGIINLTGSDEVLKVRTFPSLAALSDGTLLAACRAGSTKDSDDGTIEMFRSSDNGATWNGPTIPFEPTKVNGLRGSFQLCYLTELEAGHVLAAGMWVDRESYPGRPLFNPDTEGCLPMVILLSESYDFGNTWAALRKVPLPDEIGPPILTNPLIKLTAGSFAMSIETNKPYMDSSKWYQKVVFFSPGMQEKRGGKRLPPDVIRQAAFSTGTSGQALLMTGRSQRSRGHMTARRKHTSIFTAV